MSSHSHQSEYYVGLASFSNCNQVIDQSVAGIVLAAGGSSRLGMPKQLIRWNNEPLVRRVSRIALNAGLNPVIVVLGCASEEIRGALRGLNVVIAINNDWAEGQSTSIKAGLGSFDWETCIGCIFFHSDQPFVSSTVIRALIDEHSRNTSHIIAPLVLGQRSNPIFFDRTTFPDLMRIQGDLGGRAIFSKYSIHYLEWLDQKLLIDIDIPDDLKKLET